MTKIFPLLVALPVLVAAAAAVAKSGALCAVAAASRIAFEEGSWWRASSGETKFSANIVERGHGLRLSGT